MSRPDRRASSGRIRPYARISQPPRPHTRTCDDPREPTMKRDLDHCDRTSLARRTNRLPDCGTRAEKDRQRRERLVNGLAARWTMTDHRMGCLWRARHNGERIQGTDLTSATICPPICCSPSTARALRHAPASHPATTTRRQMVFVTPRPSGLRRAGQDVVVRIEGIGGETVTSAVRPTTLSRHALHRSSAVMMRR
jgi:hypothetical protein